MKERSKLRALQDRFLNDFYVKQWPIDRPLFGPGSPSRADLEKHVFPEWAGRIKKYLKMEEDE